MIENGLTFTTCELGNLKEGDKFKIASKFWAKLEIIDGGKLQVCHLEPNTWTADVWTICYIVGPQTKVEVATIAVANVA